MDKFPVNKIIPTVALKARLYLISWTLPRSRKLKMLSTFDNSPLVGFRKTTKLRLITSRELQRNQNTWNAVSLSVFPDWMNIYIYSTVEVNLCWIWSGRGGPRSRQGLAPSLLFSGISTPLNLHPSYSVGQKWERLRAEWKEDQSREWKNKLEEQRGRGWRTWLGRWWGRSRKGGIWLKRQTIASFALNTDHSPILLPLSWKLSWV